MFDSGLVIVSVINSSWGDQAKGTNRFIAFDAGTGAVVWISEPAARNFGTYQSTPVVAVINGQRLLVCGTSGGSVAGLKVRTGEVVFQHVFSTGPINPSPVVDGTLVYSAHGEENPEGAPIGRVVCVDAAQVDTKTKKPKLVWEYRRGSRFGLSHPAVAGGRLYIPDDSGDLFCFAGKGDGTGKPKLLWKVKYGSLARGAPLVCGDKLYIFDVNGKFSVFKLNGDKEPDEADEFQFRPPTGVGGGQVETHGTPIAVNGRLYFTTQFDTYCIGDAKATPAPAKYKPLGDETPLDAKAKPVGVRIFPAEVHTKPGAKVTLKAVYFDANGRELPAPADAKGVVGAAPAGQDADRRAAARAGRGDQGRRADRRRRAARPGGLRELRGRRAEGPRAGAGGAAGGVQAGLREDSGRGRPRRVGEHPRASSR